MDTLIASVLDGNIDAYEHLIARHQGDVWPIASVLLYDRAHTEELVCEIFTRAYQQLGDYDPQYEFRAFIKTVARQVVRERLATAEKGGARLGMFREHLSKMFGDDATAVRYQRKLNEAIDGCLGHVPENVGGILKLRYEGGADHDAIGAAFRRPVASIRQAINRTRLSLTTCIIRGGGRGRVGAT